MNKESSITNTKTGVLFVGLAGATASTLVAGTMLMADGTLPEQFAATQLAPLSRLDLIGTNQMVFGGWDYRRDDLYSMVKLHGVIPLSIVAPVAKRLGTILPMPGIRTPLDIPQEASYSDAIEPKSIAHGIEIVTNQIRDFQKREQIHNTIIVFLGSPHRIPSESVSSMTESKMAQIRNSSDLSSIPSGLVYAMAAIMTDSHFVDFTPSQTLETPCLLEQASARGVQLAGRDGSTGQTLLKLVVAEMLRLRNLHIDSWYSTNIIGNHDGYVLSLPGHSETKLADKTSFLNNLLGYSDFEHLVRIEYFKSRGDNKESWDVVDFSGWLGLKMSLHLNWKGRDSILAAPLILDIIRLIEYGSRYHLKGIQPQLGMYFKFPIGRVGTGFFQMYEEACQFYCHL